MPAIPLPFVTFIVMSILLLRLLFRQDARYRPAIAFIAACALLLLLSGVRWRYSFSLLAQIQPFLALMLPFLAWRCFSGLALAENRRYKQWLPAVAAGALMLLWPAATDFMLLLLYCGYGCALLGLAKSGPDAFSLARLSAAEESSLLAFSAGSLLCFSALIDVAVALDFSFWAGRHAATLVAAAQCLLLPLLCLAVAFSRKAPSAEPPPVPQPETPPDMARLSQVCAELEHLMQEKELYLNTDLTLNSLARKSGVPARQISQAVNLTRRCNVSQWVNGFRVNRAKQLLRHSDLSVTQIMLEAGFATKSNFNREFLRLTGLAPARYRAGEAEKPASAPESG